MNIGDEHMKKIYILIAFLCAFMLISTVTAQPVINKSSTSNKYEKMKQRFIENFGEDIYYELYRCMQSNIYKMKHRMFTNGHYYLNENDTIFINGNEEPLYDFLIMLAMFITMFCMVMFGNNGIGRSASVLMMLILMPIPSIAISSLLVLGATIENILTAFGLWEDGLAGLFQKIGLVGIFLYFIFILPILLVIAVIGYIPLTIIIGIELMFEIMTDALTVFDQM